MSTGGVNSNLVKNTAVESAPAFGVAEVVNAGALAAAISGGTQDADSYIEVRKPTGAGRLVIIGPANIGADRYGDAFTGKPFVRFTGTDPSPGAVLKAKAGEWAVSADGEGESVTVIGDVRTKGVAPNEYKIVRVETSVSGGTAGSTAQMVLIVDDHPGRTWSGDSAAASTVRCLSISQTGGVLDIDTDGDFIDATPVTSGQITNSDSGCSGDGVTNLTDSGVRYTMPVAGDNRIKSGDALETAFEVSGTINPTSSVTGNVQGVSGGAAKSVGTLPAGGTGLFTTVATDLTASTALTKGLIRVRLTETPSGGGFVGGFQRFMVLSYETQSNSQVDAIPNRPDPPILLSGPGGDPVSSNKIVSATPTFRITYPATAPSPDLTGPTWYFAIDATVFYGSLSAFDTVRQVEVTLPSAIDDGWHQVQWGCAVDDPVNGTFNYHGGPSDITYFERSPAADEIEVDPNRYGRIGWLSTDTAGGNYVFYDACRVVLSSTVTDKMDA